MTWRLAVVAVLVGLAIATPRGAQLTRAPLVLEPLGATGEAIYPALEGWGPDKNGDTLILLGYYNRNKTQALDIPIGPDNRIEPGGPDFGQPTHFYAGRQHGVFAIKVPKDFGTQKLTWALTANGQTSSISFWLNPAYWVNFYKHPANGNEPPSIRLQPDGATMTGPPPAIAQTLSGFVGKPVALTLWASDPARHQAQSRAYPRSEHDRDIRGAGRVRGSRADQRRLRRRRRRRTVLLDDRAGQSRRSINVVSGLAGRLVILPVHSASEDPSAQRTEPSQHVVHVAKVHQLDEVAVEVLGEKERMAAR
jgi:hypothetical protein